jgi:Ulp1 family protease
LSATSARTRSPSVSTQPSCSAPAPARTTRRSSTAAACSGGWLGEEIINFYMALLQDRDDRRRGTDPAHRPCHFFDSFFVAKLMGADAQSYSYKGVQRWTKYVNLFENRFVLAPVNVGNLRKRMMADILAKNLKVHGS